MNRGAGVANGMSHHLLLLGVRVSGNVSRVPQPRETTAARPESSRELAVFARETAELSKGLS